VSYRLIIFASNNIGFRVVKYLSSINQKIDLLVLDEENKGEFNQKIISCYKDSNKKQEIIFYNKHTELKIISIIKEKKSNIGILAWWPHIIKGELLNAPRNGWLNFHPSFLPFNRGKKSKFLVPN